MFSGSFSKHLTLSPLSSACFRIALPQCPDAPKRRRVSLTCGCCWMMFIMRFGRRVDKRYIFLCTNRRQKPTLGKLTLLFTVKKCVHHTIIITIQSITLLLPTLPTPTQVSYAPYLRHSAVLVSVQCARLICSIDNPFIDDERKRKA